MRPLLNLPSTVMRHPVHGLRSVLTVHRSSSVRTAHCLDEMQLAALHDGSLNDVERNTCVAHVAGCEYCRRSLVSLTRALAAPEVASEAAALDKRVSKWSPTRRVGVAAALAATLFLVIARQLPNNDAGSPHRAPAISSSLAPALKSPQGAVSAPTRLEWSTVAGARMYRVTLYSGSGGILHEQTLPDTVAVLPAGVKFTRGSTYLWRVEAGSGFDRWTGSDLVEFSITPPPPT